MVWLVQQVGPHAPKGWRAMQTKRCEHSASERRGRLALFFFLDDFFWRACLWPPPSGPAIRARRDGPSNTPTQHPFPAVRYLFFYSHSPPSPPLHTHAHTLRAHRLWSPHRPNPALQKGGARRCGRRDCGPGPAMPGRAWPGRVGAGGSDAQKPAMPAARLLLEHNLPGMGAGRACLLHLGACRPRLGWRSRSPSVCPPSLSLWKKKKKKCEAPVTARVSRAQVSASSSTAAVAGHVGALVSQAKATRVWCASEKKGKGTSSCGGGRGLRPVSPSERFLSLVCQLGAPVARLYAPPAASHVDGRLRAGHLSLFARSRAAFHAAEPRPQAPITLLAEDPDPAAHHARDGPHRVQGRGGRLIQAARLQPARTADGQDGVLHRAGRGRHPDHLVRVCVRG